MSIYSIIQEGGGTGVYSIDVKRAARLWNPQWSISEYLNYTTDEPEYTLFVLRKGKKYTKRLKVRISTEQAMELIEKLKLVKVASTAFRRAATYHTSGYIDAEIERLESLRKENEEKFELLTKEHNELGNFILREVLNLKNTQMKFIKGVYDQQAKSAFAQS